jgi:hypothetical protein
MTFRELLFDFRINFLGIQNANPSQLTVKSSVSQPTFSSPSSLPRVDYKFQPQDGTSSTTGRVLHREPEEMVMQE